MAIEKVVNVQVNIKGGAQTTAQVEKLNASLKRVKATTGEVATGMKQSGNAILENGGAMGLLNDLTGGYAMTVKDAVEASGLFTKGTTIASTAQKVYAMVVGSTTGALKALRIALVTTGLGAIVVLLGVFIAKMSESAEATEEQKLQQEALNEALKRTSDLYQQNIKDLQDVTNERILRAKIAGKSEKEIRQEELNLRKQRYEDYKIEQARLLQQLDDRKLSAENLKLINDQLLSNQKQYFASAEADRIKDLEGELSVVEQRREKLKEASQKAREDAQKAREEAEKERKEFEESVAQGQRDLQLATTEAEFEQRRIRIEQAEETQKKLQQIAEEQTRIEQEEIQKQNKLLEEKRIREEAVGNAKVDIALKTSELIRQIAGEDSKVGKGLAIAQATISGIEGVQNAFTTANKSPITVGFPAYPFIQAGLAGAFSLLQIKKIASTDPSGRSAGGSSASSGGGAQVPQAPSFNLVQGTGSNQIASGLANQRQAIQAYVVSGAVTNAQQLDRNIVNDASL
jgi:hypothetical protein